jgi:hypothetical protein
MTAPETPAELLARAVTAMRADAVRCGDVPEAFIPAVADLLEPEAKRAAQIDAYQGTPAYLTLLAGYRLQLAVATAFLGEQEEAQR